MQAIIKNVSQAFCFETGVSTGVLELQLPDGSRLSASVTDDAMAHLLVLHVSMGGKIADAANVGGVGLPRQAATAVAQASVAPLRDEEQPLAAGYSPMTLSNDDGEQEFGGDYNERDANPGGAFEEMATQLRQAEEHVERAVHGTHAAGGQQLHTVAARLGQSKLPQPNFARRVEMDEAGNPIIAGKDLVDPQVIMGGNLSGEDDVGQI